MSRPEVRGLLHDIKRRPEELSLRLILADWLEDHGDGHDRARAELIRTQVRGEGDGRALIAAHKAAWLGPLAPWGQRATFRDGLVTFTLTSGELASSSLVALADGEPWAWVDEVSVRHTGPSGRRMATNPLLAAINGFSCAKPFNGESVGHDLFRAMWLGTLRRLDLSGVRGVSRAEVEALLRSPDLASLRDLNCSDRSDYAHPVTLLARPGLQRLTLRRNQIGDRAAALIARDANFASLEELHLDDNEIGDPGARALAESPHLGRLRLLTLFGNPIGADGARWLRERFGARVLIAGA